MTTESRQNCGLDESALMWMSLDQVEHVKALCTSPNSPLTMLSENETIQIVNTQFNADINKIRFIVEMPFEVIKFRIKCGIINPNTGSSTLLELGCLVADSIGLNLDVYNFFVNSHSHADSTKQDSSVKYLLVDIQLDKDKLNIFLGEKFYGRYINIPVSDNSTFHAFIVTTDEYKVYHLLSPFDCLTLEPVDMNLDEN